MEIDMETGTAPTVVVRDSTAPAVTVDLPDEDTFEAAYDELFRAGYRVSFRILGSRPEAEDATQEALTRAYLRWRKIHPYAEAWVSRVASNLAIAGFFVTEARRLDSVSHVDVATTPSRVPGVQTILVVGTDRGVNSTAAAGADAIAVIRIDGAAQTASVLAIPRDLALTDSATGSPEKVSAIFRARGATGLVSSVQDTLGLSVSHYVQVDPDGFTELVDSIGGVDVRASASMRDPRSGLRLPGGSCTNLDGDTALALARSRSVEVERAGRWEPDGSDDIGRMQRENILGRALLTSLHDADLANPLALDHLVDTFVDHVTVDSGLHRDDLIALVRTTRSVQVDQISTAWLPVDASEQPDGASSLTLGSGWQAVVDGLVSGQVPSDAVVPRLGDSPKAAGTDQPMIGLC